MSIRSIATITSVASGFGKVVGRISPSTTTATTSRNVTSHSMKRLPVVVVVRPTSSQTTTSSIVMLNRVFMIPYPQRKIIATMKVYEHQLRWKSSAGSSSSSSSNAVPSGKPPSPRVFPTNNAATATGATTNAGSGESVSSVGAAAAAAGKESSLYTRTKNRGPVSWTSLFIMTIAAASAVTYYQIERERRLERAMGKIVSSEYNGTMSNNNTTNSNKEDGWTPRPGYLAKRKFVATPSGWFPVDDGFGPGKPAIGGPWSLVDLDGNLVTNTNFEGKWLLLYFGFARCPDICPSEMMKVGRVIDTLKKDHPAIAKDIVPVFVSIDPARDSLKALREYAKDFHPDYIFLTGTPQQVKQMAKMYRVYYSKADESVDGDYLVDHSIVIYFHDSAGDLADCFTQSMRPSDVVDKIIERYNAAMKSPTTAVSA